MPDQSTQEEIDAMLSNINTDLSPMELEQVRVSRLNPVTKSGDVVETGRKKTIPTTSNESVLGHQRVRPYKLIRPTTKKYSRVNSENGELEEIDQTHTFTQDEADKLMAKLESKNE